MKNLLIRKSFSYEIVDFTLLWQTNTYRLGGDRSIQLSYEDFFKNLMYLFIISDVTIIATFFSKNTMKIYYGNSIQP